MNSTIISLQKKILILIISCISITAFSQSGSITGVITSCSTGWPIPYAYIYCNNDPQPYIANSSGVYFIPSVLAGNVRLWATAVGYLGQIDTVAVVSGQTTIANFCFSSGSAIISGTVTNCFNGNPVVGAKITYSSFKTYSDAAGNYVLNMAPLSTGVLTCSASGFYAYLTAFPTSYSQNSYTQNIILKPEVYPTSSCNAVENGSQTAVDITWDPAISTSPLIYDDGTSEACSQSVTGGDIRAVRFTTCNSGNSSFKGFSVKFCNWITGTPTVSYYLYAADGPGGTPGTILSTGNVVVSSNQWITQTFMGAEIPPNTDLYLGFSQPGISTASPGIAMDTTTNQQRSFSKNGSNPWVQENGNFLIRPILSSACGAAPATGISYNVYRMTLETWNYPSLWTFLGTTNAGVNSFTDNGWSSAPCGFYFYAAKPVICNSDGYLYTQSNPLFKCLSTQVTIHATRCCQSMGNEGIVVKLSNSNLVDTVYYATTDVTGTAVLNNVMKGNYTVTSNVFGCSGITFPAAIFSDTVINANMVSGPATPPTGLVIDDNSLLAQWNPGLNTPCNDGYNVYINSVLTATTTNNYYQIIPTPSMAGLDMQFCVETKYNYGIPSVSAQVCDSFHVDILYPPVNFNADTSACNINLTWNQPQTSSGTMPAGLVGYNIYRDDNFIHFCPSPDSLSYTEANLNGGLYHYNCTAVYDMTSYGNPGLFDESEKVFSSDTVFLACSQSLPFFEGWNFGTFSFSGWTFEPSQDNWSISNNDGQPVPSAQFTGGGKSLSSAYENSIISPPLDASMWSCSDLRLNFDLKLQDVSSSGTEKLDVDLYYNGTWHQAAEYTNNGSFDWQQKEINVNYLKDQIFKIRFRVNGTDLSNIHSWNIDNISLTGTCYPPVDLTYTVTNSVNLSWTAPCEESDSYNVYRSDENGNPPFIKLNNTLLNATSYSDNPPQWTAEATYRYYVTSIQMNSSEMMCESASSDTITVDLPVGISEKANSVFEVYPNPAENTITIKTSENISVDIISATGELIKRADVKKGETEIDITGLSSGIYFIKPESGIFKPVRLVKYGKNSR